MRASDIILNSQIFADSTRGEALEKLEDLVFSHCGGNSLDASNGGTIDAILVLFNKLITDDHDAEMGLLASIDNLLEE